MQIQMKNFKYEMQSWFKVYEKQQCGAAIQMELDGTHVQTPSTRPTTNSRSNIKIS